MFTKTIALCIAAFAAAGIATGSWRTTHEPAPEPRAGPPDAVLAAFAALNGKTDRLPLSVPPSTQVAGGLGGQEPGEFTRSGDTPQQIPTQKTPTDKVCGRKGRHWFTKRRGYRYWRCNR